MSVRRAGFEFAAFGALFFALLVGLMLFWPAPCDLVTIGGFALYSVLALCLSVDLAECACALRWAPLRISATDTPPERRRIAVVMTICDDACERELLALLPLNAAGYDTYLLDDSELEQPLPAPLRGCVKQVRRSNRRGAKAGNLNHWLHHHAMGYEHVILLDADSIISVEACDTLARTIAATEQRDVAVVQSQTVPDLVGASIFAQVVAVGARPRLRVLETVHARLGLLLSFGHNQLLRLAAVREVGGFPERFSAEDSALSLELASVGWRIVLADVPSTEHEPDTVAAYNRRTLRWAAQTAELFSDDWVNAPLRLRLLLCRHLAGYLAPVVGALLLGLSIFSATATPHEASAFMSRSLTFEPGYHYFGFCLLTVSGIFVLHNALRWFLALKTGVSFKALCAGVLLAPACYATLIVPLAWTLALSLLGRRTRFVPTGSRHATERDGHWRTHVTRLCVAGVLLAPLLWGAVAHPASLATGFNLLWLASITLSPLLLAIVSWRRHQHGSER